MIYTISTKKTWAQTMSELENEFRKWGVYDWDTNYPKGARSERQYQEEDDRTVTLRWKKNNEEIKLVYGKQSRAVDNLRALRLTIEDMRMTEVRGVSDLVRSAYKQLGAGKEIEGEPMLVHLDPYETLGIRETTPLEIAEAAYRTMAKNYHPDSGSQPSTEKFKRINDAIIEIRKLRGGA